MSVERSGQAIGVKASKGQLVTGGARGFDGGQQPFIDGTSRMNREVQVRICKGLGVKFPGPRPMPPWRSRSGANARGHIRSNIHALALCHKEGTLTWQKKGHFYLALTQYFGSGTSAIRSVILC